MEPSRLVFAVVIFAACVTFAAAERASAQDSGRAQTTAQSSDNPVTVRRARPRIRVEKQPGAWDYPRPGNVSWPGPGYVRECKSWLAQEARPSGTVIVPRMNCWWRPGP